MGSRPWGPPGSNGPPTSATKGPYPPLMTGGSGRSSGSGPPQPPRPPVLSGGAGPPLGGPSFSSGGNSYGDRGGQSSYGGGSGSDRFNNYKPGAPMMGGGRRY